MNQDAEIPQNLDLPTTKDSPSSDLEKATSPSTDVSSPPSINLTQNHDKDNIVDWEEKDSENPLNWSKGKKAVTLGAVSMITMLSPLTSTIISPATADVLQTFNSTNTVLGSLVTSVYLLGYVAGPLFLAPLSELYGRSIVYNINNFVFLIFNVACALAPSLNSLIVFRFFTGIAASCPITLSMGTVADCVRVEKRGAATGLMYLGPLIGPTCAPLIGSYLAAAKGWRWIFWLASILVSYSVPSIRSSSLMAPVRSSISSHYCAQSRDLRVCHSRT